MGVKDKSVDVFRFKQFSIQQDRCSMKVGTDGILLGAWTDVNEKGRVLDVGAGDWTYCYHAGAAYRRRGTN